LKTANAFSDVGELALSETKGVRDEEPSFMKILVTGGAGFILLFCPALNECGIETTVFTRAKILMGEAIS
jgi:hypothetical protein